MSPVILRLMSSLVALLDALAQSERPPPRPVDDTPSRPTRGTPVIRIRGDAIEVSSDGTSWRAVEFVPRGFQRDDEGSYWKPLSTEHAGDPSWTSRKEGFVRRRLG